MKLNELTINEYSTLLASKKSAPGGGSALALVLELAIDLGMMVVNFTINKPSYEEVQVELKEKMDDLLIYKLKANKLIDEDAIAYKAVVDAFKTNDKNVIHDAAIMACNVPYELYTIAKKVEVICGRLSVIGNKNLVSDARIGANLCQAIYPGCIDNIKCNLPFIKAGEEKAKYQALLKQ